MKNTIKPLFLPKKVILNKLYKFATIKTCDNLSWYLLYEKWKHHSTFYFKCFNIHIIYI